MTVLTPLIMWSTLTEQHSVQSAFQKPEQNEIETKLSPAAFQNMFERFTF